MSHTSSRRVLTTELKYEVQPLPFKHCSIVMSSEMGVMLQTPQTPVCHRVANVAYLFHTHSQCRKYSAILNLNYEYSLRKAEVSLSSPFLGRKFSVT